MFVRPGIISGDEYLKLPRDTEDWLLRPLIPTSGSAIIYGDPKLGKTWLALQLALALSGAYPDWLGFQVCKVGKVIYLQLDTPGGLFADRIASLQKGGLPANLIYFGDRETLEFYPFDILQPTHVAYLRTIIAKISPVAVIIDTLREAHSGDEDTSTTMRNVIANLVGATHPAALILISHARKPNPDAHRDLLADNRGSSYVVGRMDAIIRLSKRHLYYTGRSIEEGSIKLDRQENGLWLPEPDESAAHIASVLSNPSLTTMRAKARALALLDHKTEEAAMSTLRRTTSTIKPQVAQISPQIAMAAVTQDMTLRMKELR